MGGDGNNPVLWTKKDGLRELQQTADAALELIRLE